MGTLAQEISWTPHQDDVLLKNAIEAGASFESLANGAANFSRRFTVQELQDRWNGLLHDPLVSVEASAGMMVIEHSKKNKCLSEKRKFDSLRQQDYAKQKRICDEPLDSTNPALTKTVASAASGIDATNLEFCDGDNISINQNNVENMLPHSFEEKTDRAEKLPSMADQTQTGEVSGYFGFRGGKFLNLTIPDCGASFHSHGYSSARSDSPLWTAIEGFSTPKFPDIGTGDGYVSVINELGYNVGLSEVMPENQLLCGDMRNSGVRSEDYLAEISNSLFDFTNEEEIQLLGSDGNVIDNDYIDGFSSLLLDSPSQNGMPNIAATEAMVPSNDCTMNSDSSCWVQVSGHPNGKERSSALNPEYRNGVICCLLNTEDRDVPCNDDVFLLTGPSLSLPFEMQWQIDEPPSLGQKVNAGDPNQRMSERNSSEQSPMTEETLQAEVDTCNSDVEIMV